MDRLKIVRKGGFGGLRATGELDADSLSEADREVLEKLFKSKGRLPAAPGADRFSYSVTRETEKGSKTIEIPEHLAPAGLSAAVKEQLP